MRSLGSAATTGPKEGEDGTLPQRSRANLRVAKKSIKCKSTYGLALKTEHPLNPGFATAQAPGPGAAAAGVAEWRVSSSRFTCCPWAASQAMIARGWR